MHSSCTSYKVSTAGVRVPYDDKIVYTCVQAFCTYFIRRLHTIFYNVLAAWCIAVAAAAAAAAAAAVPGPHALSTATQTPFLAFRSCLLHKSMLCYGSAHAGVADSVVALLAGCRHINPRVSS